MEELYRAHLAQRRSQTRIDDDRMQRTADRDRRDDGNERQQYLRAVLRHNRQQQGKYTDRRRLHDHRDDFIADLCTGIEEIRKTLALLAANLDNASTDEQREDDDRQDIRLCHRLHRVRWDHGHENLHDRRCGLDLHRSRSRHRHANARMRYARDTKANDDSNGRREQIKDQRFGADAAELLHITKTCHTNDQRGEYHRYDHHLDEIDEHRTNWCNPPFDERQTVRSHDQPDNNGQNQ